MTKQTLYEITTGITGAVIMILELVATRTLAPVIGTSTIAWTSIIGVIMAALAAGYLLGGKLADTVKANILPYILLASGVSIILSLLSVDMLLPLVSGVSDLRVKSALAALIVFTLPSVFLGSILPYCTKYTVKSMATAGQAIGRMYAFSTIGSIIGTFLAGYVLIAYVGNMKLLLCLAILLCMLSICTAVFERRKKATWRITMLIILLFVGCLFRLSYGTNADTTIIADFDTLYNRIWILDTINEIDGRPVRYLRTSPKGTQSSMYLDHDNNLVAPYLKFFRLASHFNHRLKHALMLGGGALSYPKDFIKKTPYASMDVVDIDPALFTIAKKYFSLQENPSLHLIAQDARLYVDSYARGVANPKQEPYDAVFIDVFDKQYAIPFHVTTKEFVQSLYASMSPQSVVLVNIVSSITGDKGKFLRAEVATYRQFFPQVYIFPVENPNQPEVPQNIILIALKSPVTPSWNGSTPYIQSHLNNRYIGELPEDMPILTDDFAPVEQYLMSI